jgi:hypothetical protein
LRTDNVMVRHVHDDFAALTMCEAMARMGVEPFSVTDGGATESALRFRVWGRITERDCTPLETIDLVDRCYDALRRGEP